MIRQPGHVGGALSKAEAGHELGSLVNARPDVNVGLVVAFLPLGRREARLLLGPILETGPISSAKGGPVGAGNSVAAWPARGATPLGARRFARSGADDGMRRDGVSSVSSGARARA